MARPSRPPFLLELAFPNSREQLDEFGSVPRFRQARAPDEASAGPDPVANMAASKSNDIDVLVLAKAALIFIHAGASPRAPAG